MDAYCVVEVKEDILEARRCPLERAGIGQLTDWQGKIGAI